MIEETILRATPPLPARLVPAVIGHMDLAWMHTLTDEGL